MTIWLIWEPSSSNFFITVDYENLFETKSCSICKRKKQFSISHSNILIDKETTEYIKNNVFSLDEDKLKGINKRVLFPLIGKEWSVVLSNKHDNSLQNISSENLQKAFYILLNKAKRELTQDRRHIYCFGLFNKIEEGAFYHPQLRCLSFNHLIVAPYFTRKNKNNCMLCNLFSEYIKMGGDETLFANERFVAVKSIYESDVLYFFSRKHYNYLKLNSKVLAKDLSNIFQASFNYITEITKEKYGSQLSIYASIDLTKNDHIYGKILDLPPQRSIEDNLRKILSDRNARFVAGPLV